MTKIFSRDNNSQSFSTKYMQNNLKLNSQCAEFFLFLIKTYWDVRDGIFSLNIVLNEKINRGLIFTDLLEKFDKFYLERIFKQRNYFPIMKFTDKIFFDNYLHLENDNVILNEFEKLSLGTFSLMETNCKIKDDVENENNILCGKNIKVDISNTYSNSNSNLTNEFFEFSEILSIQRNKYIVSIVSISDTTTALSDSASDSKFETHKNSQNISSYIFFKLKPILKNNWIHFKSTNSKINSVISDLLNNCENNLNYMKNNLKEIIQIESSKKMNGESIKIDLKNFERKSFNRVKNSSSFSDLDEDIAFKIIYRISYRSDHNFEKKINFRKIKNFTKIFKLKKKNVKIIFNYKVYKISEFIEKKHEEERLNSRSFQENFYSKYFEKQICKNILNKDYKENNLFFYMIRLYYPDSSFFNFFIFNQKDFSEFVEMNPIDKNKNYLPINNFLANFDEFVNILPNKLKIMNELSGRKILLKYSRINFNSAKKNKKENKKENESFNLDPEDNENNSQWNNLKIYLKTNFQNVSVRKNIYELTTNEKKLILKTAKKFQFENKFDRMFLFSFISVFYHRVIKSWSVYFIFPKTGRKFFIKFLQSDISNIPKENFENLLLDNNNEITESEIWMFLIKHSKISQNCEKSCFFEIFNLKILMKELIYEGYEIITHDITRKEKNNNKTQIVQVEMTVRSNKNLLINSIDKVADRIYLDNTTIILQLFSFEGNSFHKKVFKIEEYLTYIESDVKVEESEKVNTQMEKGSFGVAEDEKLRKANMQYPLKLLSYGGYKNYGRKQSQIDAGIRNSEIASLSLAQSQISSYSNSNGYSNCNGNTQNLYNSLSKNQISNINSGAKYKFNTQNINFMHEKSNPNENLKTNAHTHTKTNTNYPRKYINYACLRNLAILILKLYCKEKQKILIFEEKKESQETKSEDNNYPNAESSLSDTKLLKFNSVKKLYTELVQLNPTILADVLIDPNRQNVILSYYNPDKSLHKEIEISIESLRKSYLPAFYELMKVCTKSLGKKIMHYVKLAVEL